MVPAWQPPPTLGEGRYEVGRELGRGSVGVVYEVRDRQTGLTRAAKMMYPQLSGPRGLERFSNEIEALLGIDHPNVVRIFDAGHAREVGEGWYVMELMPGGTVADRLRARGALPLSEVVRLGGELLEGLAAVHRAGVVHRDVKPGNLMLAADGRCKLADFGLVRMADSDLTMTGSRLGTAFFVAPEQRSDPREVTARSDLFSVAATLCALATGRRPPDLTLLALEEALLDELPAPLRPIVARGAAYDPQDRYPSASEMRAALLAITG